VKIVEFIVPKSYLESESDSDNEEFDEDDQKIGNYSLKQRSRKILNYKLKLAKRR